MQSFRPFYYLLMLACLHMLSALGQGQVYEKPRLTVAQGLPQSYVSGLVQDGSDLVWIATFDGLAKVEGRQFKVFRHRPGDSTSLSANVIVGLALDRQQQLWIQYQGGEIDLLDTRTEHVFHFSKDPVFKSAFARVKKDDAIVQDRLGRYWLLGEKGGIFIADLQRRRLRFYTDAQLGLPQNPVTGIGTDGDRIVLATDTALVWMDTALKIKEVLPYTFDHPHLFNARRSWKANSPLRRRNGDLIIVDEDRLIIAYPRLGRITALPLPPMKIYTRPRLVQDRQGNVIFGFDGTLYRLDLHDQLRVWRVKDSIAQEKITALLLDRSGVLWAGTNGYDLRQFDLRLSRMPAEAYVRSFPEDILQRYLQVPEKMLKKMAFDQMNPYFFRWTADGQHRLWLLKAGADPVQAPNFYIYTQGRVSAETWHFTGVPGGVPDRINAIAVDPAGKGWAVDYRLRLFRLDTLRHAVSYVAHIPFADSNKAHDINSLLADADSTFWITTSAGFMKYQLKTGKTYLFSGVLPNNAFTVISPDPTDENRLWLGSLGGGLVRFDKRTYHYHTYTTDDGLPSNTVYAILPVRGELWCSSNKGVFTFGTRGGMQRSFGLLDGLPVEEFNRFHFFGLPDGRLAFGGTKGYTVFDPKQMTRDDFTPRTVLTGLKINNRGAVADGAKPRLPAAVNSLQQLSLADNENFLAFDFAALEYNMPEKLKYRYRMTRLDKQWVDAGTNNTATYTNLSPGTYYFQVNATNTAGTWSPYVRSLRLIIAPPFWLTWWFITLCTMLACGLAYLLFRLRMAEVRRQEQQKHHFEREMIALEAQALRSQMNPHFIFNCLNSIKALIHEDKKQPAILYLTTFSKLIRNQLNNTQQEISLADELQTCKLYVQMESLRFGDKFKCEFYVDDAPGIQEFPVPPLSLQPIIENAIWHGILPLATGGQLQVRIRKKEGYLCCEIEDNGIGRQQSRLNRSKSNTVHLSKGMELIASRLRLYNDKYQTVSDLAVVDKTGTGNRPSGTLVTIKFKIHA